MSHSKPLADELLTLGPARVARLVGLVMEAVAYATLTAQERLATDTDPIPYVPANPSPEPEVERKRAAKVPLDRAKELVLGAIAKHGAPISKAELVDVIGGALNAAQATKPLDELAREGVIVKIGSKINMRYGLPPADLPTSSTAVRQVAKARKTPKTPKLPGLPAVRGFFLCCKPGEWIAADDLQAELQATIDDPDDGNPPETLDPANLAALLDEGLIVQDVDDDGLVWYALKA